MKLFAKVAFAAVFIGSASFAGSIAPSDVAFGENGEITVSLTGVMGDAANGRKLFMNRKLFSAYKTTPQFHTIIFAASFSIRRNIVVVVFFEYMRSRGACFSQVLVFLCILSRS